MRILITGGCGFIGSAVVRLLAARGDCEIFNVDKLTYAGDPRAVESAASTPRYHFLHEDICHLEEMEGLFDRLAPDAVIHLAAETHVDRSIESAEPFVRTNVHGTYALLSAALRYWRSLAQGRQSSFRFLHVSTDEVYGPAGDTGEFDESAPYVPSSPYAASKAAADHFVGAWHRTYGLPTLIAHPCNNYGPWQNREKLIPRAVACGLDAEPIPVYGTGEQVRDWLYVGDHAEALLTVLAKGRPGQRYNVSTGSPRSNIEVVRAICRILDELHPSDTGHERLITFVEDRPGHDRRYALDASRIRGDLGWRPAVSFTTGLRRTVEWLVQSGFPRNGHQSEVG